VAPDLFARQGDASGIADMKELQSKIVSKTPDAQVMSDLDATIARLRGAGARFRNDPIQGPGGRQVLAEDPAGNPVELFEATSG